MYRRRFIIPAVVLAAICCSQSQAKPIDTVVYEVKLSSSIGNMGTRKMYRKGNHFVWETDSAGLKIKFIKNKDGAFMIHPKGRFIAKYPAGTNRESPMTFLPGPAGDVKEFLAKVKAKKEGEETVDKTLCDIYTYTEPETTWKCRLWVEQKRLAPVKMQMTGEKKADTIDVTYLSYRTGAVIAESRFELPEGVEIRPMPTRKTETEEKKGEADQKPAESAEKTSEKAQ